jgi:hypothetical protein
LKLIEKVQGPLRGEVLRALLLGWLLARSPPARPLAFWRSQPCIESNEASILDWPLCLESSIPQGISPLSQESAAACESQTPKSRKKGPAALAATAATAALHPLFITDFQTVR